MAEGVKEGAVRCTSILNGLKQPGWKGAERIVPDECPGWALILGRALLEVEPAALSAVLPRNVQGAAWPHLARSQMLHPDGPGLPGI